MRVSGDIEGYWVMPSDIERPEVTSNDLEWFQYWHSLNNRKESTPQEKPKWSRAVTDDISTANDE